MGKEKEKGGNGQELQRGVTINIIGKTCLCGLGQMERPSLTEDPGNITEDPGTDIDIIPNTIIYIAVGTVS